MGISLVFNDRCPVCNLAVNVYSDKGSIGIPETHVPGLEHDGDCTRIVLFHPACAPPYVKEYHSRVLGRN